MKQLVNSDGGWLGQLKLTYDRDATHTRASEIVSQAPLKVQRSFYPESPAICHNTILHTAGGVVGGDRLGMDIALGAGSRAAITTAAAGKIYGSNGSPAIQKIVHRVGTDACLEWLPQETIVFDGAIVNQHLRVDLAAGASWLGWEITRFGRTARGEKFSSGDWRAATEVYREGMPIWIDRQRLVGDADLDSPNRLAGYPIVGTLAWMGAGGMEEIDLDDPLLKELVLQARSLFPGDPHKIGVTQLTSGLLCRYRGDTTGEVRQWFTAVWHLLRHTYLDSPPLQLRVWQ